MTNLPQIEDLWKEAYFHPNEQQQEAILHTDGPLYLPAGPGSGKTRVLLWRALNLIVYQNIRPEEIYLATFTEKAALQLKEGLRALLGIVTNRTGISYDLGRMYVGTVHSLCQRMLGDRKFTIRRERAKRMKLLDELSQYFYLMNGANWAKVTQSFSLDPDAVNEFINTAFDGRTSASKHKAVGHAIEFCNRMVEEKIDPWAALDRIAEIQPPNATILSKLVELYREYGESLDDGNVHLTDFAMLQFDALNLLNGNNASERIFRHVIVDEYQDTNTIQEMIFFKLARGFGNICVVGDDDQALYRFRGATVENFVQFPHRCQTHLGVHPRTIPLTKNYRSRQGIVEFYNAFMGLCNWTHGGAQHRVPKTIEAHRQDQLPSVVASSARHPDDVYPEIAELVRQLIDAGKVADPNQVAFLFPSLKSEQVQRAKAALEHQGLRVYAPRAGRFLEVEEAQDVLGVYVHVFGKPTRGAFPGSDYKEFYDWLDAIEQRGKDLLSADMDMKTYVTERQSDLKRAAQDHEALMRVVEQHRWDPRAPYNIDQMKRPLYDAPGLSNEGKRALVNKSFEDMVKSRVRRGFAPITLDYTLKRTTSIDWSILDLFYRLCGFEHFKLMFDLAETGSDEGPICNLGLITQYLARFMDEYLPLIPAGRIHDGSFIRLFFGSYLYALFRRGESEYEDADDPFPRGRIPFLTIHQAKGLEFPVVVLGNLRKDDKGPQQVEILVRPLMDRDGEPLERIVEFDTMRMFYVALSRAKNLLILSHIKGRGQRINEPFGHLVSDPHFPRIPTFDLRTVPVADGEDKALPRNYSFTSDYLMYQKCPRQYMIFNKYGFVASRSQTQFFGSLVHHTLEDLHQHLIASRLQS
ncbi:MAG: ATP-dependent helicase [Anaerolinea sp.]|nr:ATP-dependent helicase [Anaerolinea sp.]